jgi:hypothetical protein
MYRLDPLWRQVITKIKEEIDAIGASESGTEGEDNG